MRIDIITIGNSKGIRIPKALLEQCGFEGSVEAEARDHQLILRAKPKAREGWEESFAAMHAAGDDVLLDNATSTHFDEADWKW